MTFDVTMKFSISILDVSYKKMLLFQESVHLKVDHVIFFLDLNNTKNNKNVTQFMKRHHKPL